MDTHQPRDPADTPDPRFPRTERAFNARQDWVGIWAAEQVTNQIASARPDTKRLLKPAIRRLQDTVERLCPVTLQATPDGLQTGYGPLYVGLDPTVIAASPRTAIGFTIPAWPERHPDDQQFNGTPATFWCAVANCIDAGNVGGILQLLTMRYDREAFAILDQQSAIIRRTGHTPAVAIIAGHRKMPAGEVGAGTISVISLPPSTEIQIAVPEGTA